jgi:(S)-sulfolactate dehydrogenase
MTDVLITEFFAPEGVRALSEDFDVLYNPELGEDRSQLLNLVADSRSLVVRNLTRVDAELVAEAPGLEIVARMGVGVDNIDLEACAMRGVEVATGAGLNATAVAEYVISAILWLTRGLESATARVVAGEWPRRAYIGHEVQGRQLGLLGFGTIAREVATRALGLGMNVIAHDPYITENSVWAHVTSVDMETLIRTSDVLSVHVPKTPETVGLIGASSVPRMKEGAVLINTSRGGVIDEPTVIEAVRSGHLGGAALDVFENEPVTRQGGLAFDSIPNLLLTPHIAGITAESESRIATSLVESIRQTLGPRS